MPHSFHPIMRGLPIAAAMSFLFVATVFAAAPDMKNAPPAEASVTENAVPVPVATVPVALVNGAKILSSDLKRARKVLLVNRSGVQIPADVQKELDLQAVEQLVSAELLYQAGQKLELKDIDKLVDGKLAQTKGHYSSEEEFVKAIRDMDMDEKELRDYARRDLVIANFVTSSIIPKITISDAEDKQFYEQNIDKFQQKERVRVSHILYGVGAKTTAAEKQKIREQAESIRKELEKGADFAKLAREHSTCSSSLQGGDLGYIGRGQMEDAFESAAFALKPGEISSVVETRYGYHIIKLTEKKKAETAPFNIVKLKIDEYLKGQKVNAAIKDFLADARKTAKVEVLLK